MVGKGKAVEREKGRNEMGERNLDLFLSNSKENIIMV